jgi:hypothetical protein
MYLTVQHFNVYKNLILYIMLVGMMKEHVFHLKFLLKLRSGWSALNMRRASNLLVICF